MIKFLLKTNLLYQISPDLNCVIFALISFYLSLTISESFVVGIEVRSILLDISKAFDTVWYDGISFKLTQNRILRNLLNFLHDFLNEKKQIVVLNGQVSIWIMLEYLRVPSLVLYCFWFTLMILQKVSLPIQSYL